ncbi:MAG: amidohydrolase family protein [Acidimicrobiia bacterium]|nr:amidohydrolase family protein [Acidimicrobiia bacterium]
MADDTRWARVENARLLTCIDETVIENGTVVVDGELIAWAGPTADLPPKFASSDVDGDRLTVQDVGGATVMPGLVDGHMHISFGEPESEEELYIYTPSPYRAIRAAVNAEKVLLAGVTTACDPGGPIGIAAAVRDAVDVGLVQGPRLSVAGRQITTQQGIGDTLPRWVEIGDSSYGALVTSRDELLEEIRNEVKDGVDLVKIAGSGPGTTEYGAFRLDELELAVDEAHRLGRPVAMHARSRQSVADAVDAGIDWIMHASYMDLPTLERVIETGTPLLPAMTLLVNSLEAGTMAPATKDAMQRELDAAVSILTKAHQLGATLIAGSETGFAMTPYGQWHTREMELFVSHLGMSDIRAILCMTRDAAIAAPRHTRMVGTLEAGKYADFLVVDGRPDEDVTILADRRRFRSVVKGGLEVVPWRPADLPAIRQPFERGRPYTAGLYERQPT